MGWVLPLLATFTAACAAQPGASDERVEPIAAGAVVLTCAALRVERGAIGDGQSAATLARRELSGTTDTWSRYVEFSAGASAVCRFDLPAGTRAADFGALELRTNYRGPRRADGPWVFEAWDAASGAWVTVATNDFAADWRWSPALLAMPGGAARFASAGAVQVRFRSERTADAAQLDELVVVASPPAGDGGVTADAGASLDASTPPPPVDAAPPPPADAAPPADARDASPPPPPPGDAAVGAIWHPTPGTSWQWQISGTIDTSVDASVYDIDLFETPQATIDALHARGRRVICYFDTAYEPGRPDSSQFTAAVLGNAMEGWPGERWVDIRSTVVRDIMARRMDLAVSKHCDAVEPDDLDVYQNNPGFPITPADQLAFARFLASAAHARGMGVALKNDIDQVAELVDAFDFAINEQCFQYNECAPLQAFIRAGKAVFQVEYGAASLATSVCPRANAMNFDTLIKRLELDAWRVACR